MAQAARGAPAVDLSDSVVSACTGTVTGDIGNPLETTDCLPRSIFDGTFDKFPGLRVCAAHAGGYLPSYLGRTEAVCVVRSNAGCANTRRPSEYLKSQILVDTMVFSEEGLRHLVAEVGAGQVVYGTDIPFNWPVTVDLVLNAPFLNQADKEAILGGNLMSALRIGGVSVRRAASLCADNDVRCATGSASAGLCW